MSDYPRIHPRFYVVRDAVNQLKDQLVKTIQEQELTEGEQLQVVSQVYADWIQGMAKYIVRDERHGDTTKRGDLAPEPKEFDVEEFCKDTVPPPKE